jgi:CDP-paratose 2-epimerase
MDKILIVGGAGFIGTNLAAFYAKKGQGVLIVDNLKREKTEHNLLWLKQNYPENIRFIKADICTENAVLRDLMEEVDVVFHLAAQVAVTTSIQDPVEDCRVNILGTLNVLEAIRQSKKKPVILYSSTNKVYGDLHSLNVIEKPLRYVQTQYPFGIAEEQQLDFHSPYGCSKGAADQYVRDYARIYGLKTIVFRQSCIYGCRQFGIEDQGWVAWFIIAAQTGKQVTIYGDGKQVRDLLFVDDLCAAYDAAVQIPEKTSGKIYNIGGGPANTLSLLELIQILEKKLQKKIPVMFAAQRLGDQRIFIADIRNAFADFNWKPRIGVQQGIEELFTWVQEQKELFTER